MAEVSRRDIRASAVSKTILEQSSMDLTNLRIGKQRIVSKKKKMSKLKKTILEDREFREGDSKESESAPSRLNADAPAFMPAEWLRTGTEEDRAALETQLVPAMRAPLPAGPVAALAGGPAGPAPSPDCDPTEDPSDGSEEIEPLSISEKSQKPKEAVAKPADLEVRHYVHQELSDDLDEKVKFVLSELVRFQDRAKEQNPMKYAKLKRYCVGLREARRAITRSKCKGLIVAPNLETSSAEGGLDDTVEDVIELAREHEVPVVFALSRNRIGKAMGKNIRLSIVALHSVDGVHQQFKEIVKTAEELRRRWVLRQMAHATSEFAEQVQKRTEEKAARDAARREEKERLAEEKAAEELRRREASKEAKAARAEAKARKVAEQKEQAERRREEKEALAKEREDSFAFAWRHVLHLSCA
ncbi:Secisbp2l [Symbiodinium necroappetens]|uniref:Secisbp2l protein n=1 Tax=Symbiodinium necroappetens TaxID=1628268 RepID=A0A812ZNB3_9DINO|nr:Secisbp2l [Symbiodinium necroappetens]